MTVAELIESLQRSYDPLEPIAALLWTKEDIGTLCEQKEIEYSDDLAEKVLEAADNNKDASLGISWDTIEVYMPGGMLDVTEGA